MAKENTKFVDGTLNVISAEDHKKNLAHQDGGYDSKTVAQELQETEASYAQAKLDRARRRKESAEKANKAQFQKETSALVEKDNQSGEAAKAREEDAKIIQRGDEGKKKFWDMVKARGGKAPKGM